MKNKAQVSMEYLILIGFVTFVIIGILVLAFVYSGTMKDRIKITQSGNFANKVISTAETVFYSGEPSRATITVYMPEGIKAVEIRENNLILSVQLSTGLSKTAFSSNVPISGSIDATPGLKKIRITAGIDETVIAQV